MTTHRHTRAQLNRDRLACRGVPNPTEVAARATYDALNLICDVRDLDPAVIWGRLTRWADLEPDRLKGAVVALAAMGQPDRPAHAALAWTRDLTHHPLAANQSGA